MAAAIVLVSSACGDSPEPGETEVADLPGVRRVDVMPNDGDNDIPEEPTPEHVTVVMKGDATLGQISAVFDAYAKEIDSGKITGVRVILQGPKRASVATGAGIHASEPLIQDLLDAQQDQAIIGYRRQDYPVLPSVELTMAADGFDSMLAMADRYRAPGEIDYVAVVSGDFILMRDAVNGNPARGAAREEFTRQVDDRFHLTGCGGQPWSPQALGCSVRGRSPAPIRRPQRSEAGGGRHCARQRSDMTRPRSGRTDAPLTTFSEGTAWIRHRLART